MGILEYGTDTVPKSALFIPGFGMGEDHPLAKAFLDIAAANDVDAQVAQLVDVDGSYSVVPSVEEQVARTRELLGRDLIIAMSAGAVIAGKAFKGVDPDPEQRLVLLNPSVRRPDFIRQIGRTGTRLTSAELGLAPEYGGIDYVLPGQRPTDREIAVSKFYMDDVLPPDYDPRRPVAELLSQFSSDGDPRARILRVIRDTRLGPTHLKLMDEVREQLDPQATVGVTNLEYGDHFFSKQEPDVMANILSGRFFSSGADEIWTSARITESSAS